MKLLVTPNHREAAVLGVCIIFVFQYPFITRTDLHAFLADTRWSKRAAFV
jgi:hypothetical protein